MVAAQRIRDDIYCLKFSLRGDWFGSIFAVMGRKRIGVIDSGFEDTPEATLFPFLQSEGRSPAEIHILVNTHRDGDHVLGNAAIIGASGAQLASHELEAEEIGDVDILLKDEDTVEVGDRLFRVVHVPGHRPGNICLYDEDDELLITGDAITGERKDLIRMGKVPYIASLNKLRTLPLRLVVMSHPFPPAGTNVLTGSAINTMFEASIRTAEELEE